MAERLLFYNEQTGAGSVGALSESAYTHLHSFPDGSFPPNWSHLAELPGSHGRLVFYSASPGSAVVGRVTPENTFGIRRRPPR